jgi:hypothetical protein
VVRVPHGARDISQLLAVEFGITEQTGDADDR